MDIRALMAGIISLTAIIGVVLLAALNRLDAGTLAMLGSVATGGLTYTVGLYSDPYDGEPVDDEEAPAE